MNLTKTLSISKKWERKFGDTSSQHLFALNAFFLSNSFHLQRWVLLHLTRPQNQLLQITQLWGELYHRHHTPRCLTVAPSEIDIAKPYLDDYPSWEKAPEMHTNFETSHDYKAAKKNQQKKTYLSSRLQCRTSPTHYFRFNFSILMGSHLLTVPRANLESLTLMVDDNNNNT